MSTTTPTVIRDGIDPMIVTTKFDVDHEYDGTTEQPVLAHVDITAALYVQHGDSAIKLDFGVFGDPNAEYLETEYEAEIAAIDALMQHLLDTRVFLMESYGQARA